MSRIYRERVLASFPAAHAYSVQIAEVWEPQPHRRWFVDIKAPGYPNPAGSAYSATQAWRSAWLTIIKQQELNRRPKKAHGTD